MLGELSDVLYARRRLPPGAHLPELARPDERHLLAEVLALAEATNPLAWLERERAALAARLALQATLERVRGAAVGAARARQAGYPVPAEVRAVYGGLLAAPEDAWDFPWLRRPPDASVEAVVAAFRRVQRQWGGRHAPLALDQPGDWPAFVLRLFAPPETADPLRWPHAELGPAVAGAALRYLLEQSAPPRTVDVGQVLRRWRPRATLRSGAPQKSAGRAASLLWHSGAGDGRWWGGRR